MEHLCKVKELLDDRLAVFKECLEGGALIWWQNLDQDVKEDWEETRQAFVEEYVGTIAYQLILELEAVQFSINTLCRVKVPAL